MSLTDKIAEIEEEIANTKYNKATQHHIGKLKAKLAQLREEVVISSSGPKGSGYGVRKAGDATVALVGLPSVGKSTLLNFLTDAESETGSYAFTTLDVVPGVLKYKDANIQILDLPGLIEGAARGAGRGKEVLSVIRSADLIVHVIDAVEPAPHVILKELFDSGKPIDTVTVSEVVFKDKKNTTSLKTSSIARLVDNVPSSANFERYIEIVQEQSNRRKLLKASSRIELLAYATDKDIHNVMDEAEQSIFSASDDAIGEGLIGVSDVLDGAIERIEEIENQGTGLSGLATHFADLDSTLAGLQDGNLVVIAARPSMGKTSLAINIATNVSKEKKVTAFFSLEMTKEELVQRVLFSEAKVTSGDARKGQLGPEKWSRVVEAASKVNNMPLYFDDASVITVTDIRAKSRRLKASKGLDLIVVDYLQLMQGMSGDNRQQEIAEISRNLKNLARELKVPIIALSQLNRAAEAREDKRPRL